jgi:hypothetical protein
VLRVEYGYEGLAVLAADTLPDLLHDLVHIESEDQLATQIVVGECGRMNLDIV